MTDQIICNFCGKVNKEIECMIKGEGAYICNECVSVCNYIIEEELEEGLK